MHTSGYKFPKGYLLYTTANIKKTKKGTLQANKPRPPIVIKKVMKALKNF